LRAAWCAATTLLFDSRCGLDPRHRRMRDRHPVTGTRRGNHSCHLLHLVQEICTRHHGPRRKITDGICRARFPRRSGRTGSSLEQIFLRVTGRDAKV
jgi:hypothetical protein